ncbi:MAG TPA: histidine kinase, partial [Vicinamibacterales bacterium]|nr:histidine kinase [Vicinamibacterales bacterium]
MALRLRPSLIVSAAWIGPAVLGAVNELAQHALSGDPPPRTSALLFAGGDWLIYAFFTPIVFVLSARWPLTRPHVARNAAIHALLSLAFCVAWAAVGVVLRALLVPETIWGGGPGRHFVSWLFITLPFGVSVYLAVVGIEHAVRYFAETQSRELQMARLSEQLAGARLAALQAQFNPHFLFNTLNTIAVLVRDNDRAAATRIVEQLSEVLRRTLTRHRANEVTLDEELDLVRQYTAIEQARFSDRLRVTYNVDAAVLVAAVPSFAVQHLVENAIRHGIARSPDAGRVTIEARRVGDFLEVTVTDDG